MFLVLEGKLIIDLEGESIVITAPYDTDPDFGADGSVCSHFEEAPSVHRTLCSRANCC